jgi:hypothetical protein
MIVPRIMESKSVTLGEKLFSAGFKREEHSIETPPVESYVKIINDEEITLEFLTHRRTRNKIDSNVIVSGISAQPLSYLEMSLS